MHRYGSRPEFVLLGVLVPHLLCSAGAQRYAGTTDVDVQVDLGIAAGSVNTRRLEQALRNAEFVPDGRSTWRWTTTGTSPPSVIKFELPVDHETEPAEATIIFDERDVLGAVNLRGTGFVSRDIEVRELRALVGGVVQTAEISVTGLGGFLLAKHRARATTHPP